MAEYAGMTEFYGKYLRGTGALFLALALGACATDASPSIKEQVAAAGTPTQGLVMAANNLAALTRALPAAVDAMDSAGKCAQTTEQLADALEAVVIAETRYMKAVSPAASDPPEVRSAMQQLDIANNPQVSLSFKNLAAKCRLYSRNRRVTDAIARLATACNDIEQLEKEYNAKRPHPKAPTKSTKGKGKGKTSGGTSKHSTTKSSSKSKGSGSSSTTHHHHHTSSQ